jgi:hypothetical protein
MSKKLSDLDTDDLIVGGAAGLGGKMAYDVASDWASEELEGGAEAQRDLARKIGATEAEVVRSGIPLIWFIMFLAYSWSAWEWSFLTFALAVGLYFLIRAFFWTVLACQGLALFFLPFAFIFGSTAACKFCLLVIILPWWPWAMDAEFFQPPE